MTPRPRAAARIADVLRQEVREGYDPEGEVDLPGFAASATTYAVTVAAGLVALRASGRQLPERYELTDVLLGGLATHKFSRLLAKGSVTSPIRAPFTEFEGPAGSAEHHEEPRGAHGFRHTVGELLTCPFCVGVWTGTAYVAGLALAPRLARTWAAAFSVVGVSDALQHGYARLRRD
ncbi:MAG TPA: DUF1360 domain-containing protein [Nocardioides sp.]|uniref:DUF1360 domain-containing protein n=1 Tax=Nocardioides sp. TaxID=35761 RepID=UPI002ED9604D